MTRRVLVPSPFTGASAWRALAARLTDAVAADHGGVAGPDWYEGVARRIAAQAGQGPWICVMHSGAGGFAPAIAAASPALTGFLYVDAVLPYPGRSCLENAPEDLAARLRGLASDGLLPPWNQWFDADPAPRLIPDPARRRAFVADLPRTPFAFLEASSPDDAGWERLPAAYVQLSRAYDRESAEAERRGWTVRRARLHHLAMVSDPDKVAALLDDLPLSGPRA